MPKISVVIAIYKGGERLRHTLDGLLAQTLDDIEIICIDDASPDNSLAILQEYEAKDRRVRVVSFEANRGTVCARKAGVEAATGDYLMFMDQDDSLKSHACSELYEKICEKDVDILHFCSQVVAVPPTTEAQRRWQEDFMKPFDGFLFGRDVFFACFDTHPKRPWNLYTWNLWNKIYRTAVCKYAMRECAEDYVVNGDDIYVYMLIAYYAKSYFGDAGGPYYHVYRLGSGLMGNFELSLSRFYTICRRVVGVKNEQLFLQSKEPDDRYEQVLDFDFSRCLKGIVQRWYNRLSEADKAAAFDMMREHLPLVELVAGIDRDVKAPAHRVLSAARDAESLRIRKKAVTTIGVCAADAVAPDSPLLAAMHEWEKLGYRVVVFLDQHYEGIEEPAFPTVVLPLRQECSYSDRPLKARMEALDNALKKYDVDALIIAGRRSCHFLGDVLLAKCRGLAVALEAFELDSKDSEALQADIIKFGDYLLALLQADGVFAFEKTSRNVLAEYDISCLDTDDYRKAFAQILQPHKRASLEPMLLFSMKKEAQERLKAFVQDERTICAFNLEAIWQQFRTANLKGKVKVLARFLRGNFGHIEKVNQEKFNRYNELQGIVKTETAVIKIGTNPKK
jgi:glycosyltransferase involved in cell wall biosynthesis